MDYLIEKREDNVVSASLFKETEGKKQKNLRAIMDILIEDAHKSGSYALEFPYFVIHTFLKFTPGHRRLRFDTKEQEWQLYGNTLYYVVRATVPLPIWGTNAYLVETGTNKHAPIWALPHLARNNPLYTYQRSVKAKRPRFEIKSIVGMLNGDLAKTVMEHNLDPKIREPLERGIKDGTIPLVKTGTISEPYCASPIPLGCVINRD